LQCKMSQSSPRLKRKRNNFAILIYRIVGSLFFTVKKQGAGQNRNINRETEIFRVFLGTFDLHKQFPFPGDSFTLQVLGTLFGVLCKLRGSLWTGSRSSRFPNPSPDPFPDLPCPRLHQRSRTVVGLSFTLNINPKC